MDDVMLFAIAVFVGFLIMLVSLFAFLLTSD